MADLHELRALAEAYGITHLGVAPAAVLQRARDALHERRDAGLHDGMGFTYRNPERSTDPGQAVRGAQSVIVGARPYLLPDPPAKEGVHARVARYAWTDHYERLREGLWAVAHRLRADGWKAVAFADDNSMVDREVAHRAGLGWFGKSSNLLLEGGGSWFVLGSVVTDAVLPTADAPVPDGCGPCRRCIDACPTRAIVAPGVVDASRCLAWLLQKPGIFPREHRVAVGDRIYGCDDCQEACPPTVRLGRRYLPAQSAARDDDHAGPHPHEHQGGEPSSHLPHRGVPGPDAPHWGVPGPDAPPQGDPGPDAPHQGDPRLADTRGAIGHLDATVDVLALLEAGDDEIIDRWGRWYLSNREPRWLRRNALLVVGNSATIDARVVEALAWYLRHEDPMLRAHAVWAAARLGLRHLLPARDPDPDVAAELAALA